MKFSYPESEYSMITSDWIVQLVGKHAVKFNVPLTQFYLKCYRLSLLGFVFVFIFNCENTTNLFIQTINQSD